MSHRARRAGFSLVELIVVIAIVVILLGAGLSLFGRSRGHALRTGTEQFASLVEQARTSAITRRRPVVLAIAEPGVGDFGDDRCRVGLFELDKWRPGEANDGRLIQRWQPLPTGIALVGGEVDTLANVKDEDKVSLTWKAGNASAEMPALVFGPRGGLIGPAGSESVVVTFAAGVYRDGQVVVTGKERGKVVRVGRVVARPWLMDR
jgi:prepilin-type N-terminal cleavage/methylation domain-containing protein